MVSGAGLGVLLAVIAPRGRNVTALPKGHIDVGETAELAALREVREETGLVGEIVEKLGEVKYSYRFSGKRIDKQVTFFLVRATGGQIDALDAAMRKEVDRARWIRLADATTELTYPGERELATRALEVLSRAPASRLE